MDRFNYTTSKTSYTEKPEVAKIIWTPTQLDTYELYLHVMSGYTITGDYGFTSEFHKGRTKDNWKSSAFIFVDLDDIDIDWNTFVDKMNDSDEYLTKPTFMYTTYSHGLPNKGNRYRIVYNFDRPIMNANEFESVTCFYNKEIKDILGLTSGIDTCNTITNQIMHGTNPNALSCYNGNVISLEEIHNAICIDSFFNNSNENVNVSSEDTDYKVLTTIYDNIDSNKNNNDCHNNHIFSLVSNNKVLSKEASNKEYNRQVRQMRKNNENMRKKKPEIFSNEEKLELYNQSYTEYLKANEGKYTIYKDNWSQLGNRAKRKDIINLLPKSYTDKITGEVRYYKYHDGWSRKKKLITVAWKVRVLNPNVTKEELLYNVVNWMYNYVYQDKDPITWTQIISIVTDAMDGDKSNYLLYRAKRLGESGEKWKRNPYTTPKRKYTKVKEKIVDDFYNLPCGVSIPFEKEPPSADAVRKLFDCARSTAYKIKKEKFPDKKEKRDIATEIKGKSVKEIMEMYGCSRATAYRHYQKYGNKNEDNKLDNKEIIKEKYFGKERYSVKQLMEVTNLSMSQVYKIIKELKAAGVEFVKIDVNIDQSLTDYSTYNDTSINFNGKQYKSDEFAKEFGAKYAKIEKYFKDREALREFLCGFAVQPRKNVCQSNNISMKITKAEKPSVKKVKAARPSRGRVKKE